MDADTLRLQYQAARHEQGTLLEIARIILAFADNLDDLTREICREIVERHGYEHVAIYLSHPENRPPKLAHGARLGPNLSEPDATALAADSLACSQSLATRNSAAWRVAVPIDDGNTTLGVIIAASTGPDSDAQRALALCKTLARLIAIGLQNASLRRLGRVDIYSHLYVENPLSLEGEG